MRTHRLRNVPRIRLLALAALLIFSASAAPAYAASPAHPTPRRTDRAAQRVLIVGSSVADGWVDPMGGYLRRAFRAFSNYTGVPFDVVSSAVPGASSVQQAPAYPGWLEKVHPSIVVISWGALDDAHDKTPLDVFGAEVQNEIRLAQQIGAAVFVVTPPVTKASYTTFRILEPLYLDKEMEVAQDFHNPYIWVFNVFLQMKEYLAEHHQTYVPYMANGWHPNSRGHALAGRLLFHDLKLEFPGRSVPLPPPPPPPSP